MKKDKVEGRGEFEGCSPRTPRGAAQCSPCLIAGKEVIGRRLVVERGEDWMQGAIISFNASSSESKCHKVQLPPCSPRFLYPVHLHFQGFCAITQAEGAGGSRCGMLCAVRVPRNGSILLPLDSIG